METTSVLGIAAPCLIIFVILGIGFNYGYTSSDRTNTMYENIPLEEYTCEYIKNRITFLDENRVLGYDSDKIIKTLEIKSAKLECGF